MRPLLLITLGMIIALTGMARAPEKSPEQIKIDSLLNEAWKLGRSQPQQSIALMEAIEALYPNEGDRYKEDVLLYYYGVFYKNLSRFDLSEIYFNRYEEWQRAADHPRLVAAVNMAKANLYSDMGDFTRSMEAAVRALSIYESTRDTLGVIRTSSKLGHLLTEANRPDEAIAYLEQSLDFARAAGELAEEQIAYTNLGVAYEKKRDYPAALSFYQRAYDIGEAKEGDYDKVLNRYNLAHVLTRLDRWEAAIPFAEACADLADSINIPDLSAASRRLLADIFLEKGQYQAGITLLRAQTDTTAYPLGLKDQTEVYELLVKAYRRQGDYPRAFGSMEIFKTLSDSLNDLESRSRLNELSIQYETEKKKQQIALLDLENQSANAVIRQKNRTITMGALGLLLVSGLSVFLFQLYRKYRRQQQELTKTLEEKEYLIKEIHHRVKNNLQIISSLLQLQARYVEEPTALEALNDGESRVRSMSIIHHHLYTGENLSQVHLAQYVNNLCENLRASYRPRHQDIRVHQDIAGLFLDVSVMIPLGLILNELLTNAFKYAFPGREQGNIWVRIAEEENGLLVLVRDDGVGMQSSAVQTGFGTRLIQAFLRKLEAEAETVHLDPGTEIRIRVRDYVKNTALRQVG